MVFWINQSTHPVTLVKIGGFSSDLHTTNLKAFLISSFIFPQTTVIPSGKITIGQLPSLPAPSYAEESAETLDFKYFPHWKKKKKYARVASSAAELATPKCFLKKKI